MGIFDNGIFYYFRINIYIYESIIDSISIKFIYI